MNRARRLSSAEKAPRSDRGQARIDPKVEAELQRLLHTTERPSPSDLAAELRRFCRQSHVRAPSRSSIYNALGRARAPEYDVESLPLEVRAVLHNRDLGEGRRVPGDLLVFHAFNYGSPRVLSFAASLPWLCLYKARSRRGWRPKSRALLEAVMGYREM